MIPVHTYRVWYIQGGAGFCPSTASPSKGAASLVPGAQEHQQKASRPWVFGKTDMFGLKVLVFESKQHIRSV